MIRKFLLLLGLICPFLAGCSLSPAISHQTTDYFRANDLAANQIILLNILRARDGAPLHFSELSQIRGQLTVQFAGSTTFPYGPIGHATQLVRRLGTVGLTVSSAPSFDISSLDTKDFTDGVMTPISPQDVEFFLDEGTDYRMVLMLLVSGIRPAGTQEMILNAPDSSRMVCYSEPEHPNAPPVLFSIVSGGVSCPQPPEPEYYTYLRAINGLGRLYPVSVILPPKPIGAPFPLNIGANLRAVAALDPSKYTLAQVKSGPNKGMFQLMTPSHGSSIALCETTSAGPQVVSVLTSGDE
jgi:hypothetical protein